MKKFLLLSLIGFCLDAALMETTVRAQDSFELARARIIEETMNRLEREMEDSKLSQRTESWQTETDLPEPAREDIEDLEPAADYFNSKEPEDFSGGTEEPGRLLQADLQIFTGFRQDNFDWNIAGNIQGGSPNILSELTWSDLSMTQIKAKGRLIFKDHLVLDGYAAYADIYSGENQDSDFSGNNRTSEFSRSNNSSDDGEAEDLSAGAGYRFFLGGGPPLFEVDHLWLTILGGYSRHELNLVMTDGFQTIPATGSFTGLHSNYWAEWEGPWTGFELFGKKKKLSGLFRFEYHWADYYGSANWNLRSDFQHPKSYEHTADGVGFVFNLGTAYHFNDRWSIDLNADIQDWETGKGIDRTFFSSGTISETQLNEVNWDSYAIMLGAACRF